MFTNYKFMKLRFHIKSFENGHWKLPSDNLTVNKNSGNLTNFFCIIENLTLNLLNIKINTIFSQNFFRNFMIDHVPLINQLNICFFSHAYKKLIFNKMKVI